MNVVLMGYRGSGKTSVGQALAARTGRGFADVDAGVVARFGGASIREIWAEHGEPAFRAVEAEVTAELVAQPEVIVALGGGTLMFEAARRAVEAARDARRIYLYAPAAVLAARIAADPQSGGHRPNLTALGGGVAEVEAVLAERDPVYRAVADVVVDVSGRSVEAVVEAVLAA